ncbi:MAG: trehalose 6-phosphate phosphatase [Actinomycetota bacterium]|nr:trehalose 6-phosphate phosphatase [Actinomycetota bacterium]
MPLPRPATLAGADGLRAIIATPERALVALDFDGTLSPIVDDPASARPQPDAPALLRRLARTVGTVAIITGRPAATAAAMLGLVDDPPPANLLVVGQYGFERWTPSAGVVQAVEFDAGGVDEVRAGLPRLLREVGAPDGTVVEDKGVALAVHVRRTADPDAAMSLLTEPLASLAREHRMRLEPGRLVLELRPAGVNKGIALASIAHATDARAVCYVGDDLGDLAAFDALDRLRSEGRATLAICSGSAEVAELAARADLVVDGPGGVVSWLKELIEEITR